MHKYLTRKVSSCGHGHHIEVCRVIHVGRYSMRVSGFSQDEYQLFAILVYHLR